MNDGSMITRARLEADLKDALRARDERRKLTLRGILASVQRAEVELGGPLDEAGLTAVMQKEAKARRESIADAQKANRPEIVAAEQAELAIIESYLPKMLSEEELVRLVQEALAESGAADPKQIGAVMKILGPKVKGRADGRVVNELVRQELSRTPPDGS